VHNVTPEIITEALNAAQGTQLEPSFLQSLGMETLRMEREFNRAAGFTEKDDELPDFFYSEPLPPTNKAARHHSAEVNRRLSELLG
jgi:aldehyde:ferredoxin oxidoreductase